MNGKMIYRVVCCVFRECRRWLYITWRLYLFFGVACLIASALWAWIADKADYFSRAGSLVCLAGGVMTFRHYLRDADNPSLRDTGRANQPAFRTMKPMEAHMQAPQEDRAAMGWGIFYIVAGTLIWGYGDLLLKAFGLCHQ